MAVLRWWSRVGVKGCWRSRGPFGSRWMMEEGWSRCGVGDSVFWMVVIWDGWRFWLVVEHDGFGGIWMKYKWNWVEDGRNGVMGNFGSGCKWYYVFAFIGKFSIQITSELTLSRNFHESNAMFVNRKFENIQWMMNGFH